MTIFNIKKYPKNKYPIIAYSSKSSCIITFLKDIENQKNSIYYKMSFIIKDIINLYCKINDEFSKYIKNKKWRIHNTDGCLKLRDLKKKEIPLNIKSHRVFSNAILFPILCIFKKLIIIKGEKLDWKKEPFEYFNNIIQNEKNDIFHFVWNTYKKERKNIIHELGKSTMFWSMLDLQY